MKEQKNRGTTRVNAFCGTKGSECDPKKSNRIIDRLFAVRAARFKLVRNHGLGAVIMGIIAAAAIGCAGDTIKDCESNCQRQYDECMADASSIGDEIECGQLKQICATNCVANMTGYKRSILGPGSDESFTTKMRQDINSATENTLESMENCPCQETEGHEN